MIFKFLKYLIYGIFFGIILSKAEVISWYRIQEMFLFDNFHMYGVIGTAVCLGALSVALIKKFKAKDIEGNPIVFKDKEMRKYSYIVGGTIFGLGWALTGACPGPMYILVGQGYWVFILVIISALFGTFTYGALKNRLPH
jgi:uncharacterized protein